MEENAPKIGFLMLKEIVILLIFPDIFDIFLEIDNLLA